MLCCLLISSCLRSWSTVPNESVIAPSSVASVVDAVDGPIMRVVMMEEGVDICLNDEEASSEVLDFDEEDEDEDSEQREPNEQGVREGAVVGRKYGW